MPSRTHLTDDDEGKRVVDADGREVGVIVRVRDETADVEPDPGIASAVKSRLGWSDIEDTHPISEDRVEFVSADEVRLRRL